MIISQENYVDYAQTVMQKLSGQKVDKRGRKIPKEKRLTTSKIRNLLAMTSDIYNQIINVGTYVENLDPGIRERIEYLRVRFVYESGRDDAVEAFVDESKILEILKEINGKRKNFLLFQRYMEALVAFHRYYGGKD